MVNFQRTPKPRNYLARREQWRLLLLVLSLGLVVLLMGEVRKPDNWGWFFALTDAPIDVERRTTGRYFPGVKPEYFDAIRDDTIFRPQEQEAWFNLLGILKENDEATLRRESTGRVTYAQLLRQSEEYRGELVTLRGTVRRAHRVSAPENDRGIKNYYQTWLRPAGADSPIVVYCLGLPKGFPTGMQIAEEAEITGFFFKRWAYRAKDGIRSAPTLLAGTVRWHKAPVSVNKPPPRAGTVLAMVGVAVAVSLFVAVYVYRRTQPVRSDKPGTPPKFDALHDANTSSDLGLSLERADRRGPRE